MKRGKTKKRMKIEDLNVKILNREEKETGEDDKDWDKKVRENERDRDDDFHEEVYDS